MGALVVLAAVVFALVGVVRTRGRRRRLLALAPGAIAAIGLVASVSAFVSAASGDTGDMDAADVVLLGLLYLAVAVGLGLLAHRLAFRR
jgi:hypothetical protein